MRQRINEMIRNVIILAKSKHPNMQNKMARGFYGVDVILDSELHPKLFEFTFSPECKKPAELRSTFWSEILGCLFYGDKKAVNRIA